MKGCDLYIILDREVAKGRDLVKIAHQSILGGARLFQLRDKVSSGRDILAEARRLRDLTRYMGCLFILNDRIDIALAADADGVHLGQDDMPYHLARKLVGRNKLIGVSATNLTQALTAQENGADYIGVGPIYATGTKPGASPSGPDIIPAILKQISIPSFFLGGINPENIGEVVKRGASSVAVASAVVDSADPMEATRALISALRETEKRAVAI